VLLVANKCHPLTPNCSELDMFGVCRNTLSLKCSGRWCRHWTQICNGSFSSECAPRLKSVMHKSQDDFANDICFICFTMISKVHCVVSCLESTRKSSKLDIGCPAGLFAGLLQDALEDHYLGSNTLNHNFVYKGTSG
jgi:hypothetical protein